LSWRSALVWCSRGEKLVFMGWSDGDAAVNEVSK
jgi:hypothetical protein